MIALVWKREIYILIYKTKILPFFYKHQFCISLPVVLFYYTCLWLYTVYTDSGKRMHCALFIEYDLLWPNCCHVGSDCRYGDCMHVLPSKVYFLNVYFCNLQPLTVIVTVINSLPSSAPIKSLNTFRAMMVIYFADFCTNYMLL